MKTLATYVWLFVSTLFLFAWGHAPDKDFARNPQADYLKSIVVASTCHQHLDLAQVWFTHD